MTTNKETKSAAIQLLDLVWGNANTSTARSWERLNHSMRDALSLVIGAGFELAIGDVQHVFEHYGSGHWIGDSTEWVYAFAIGVENKSAIASYESNCGRVGIIADDVSLECRGGYTHGSWAHRERERLAVGFTFPWKGQKVTVTSFAADQSYVNACSYKPQKKGEYRNKIDKRYKIGREDIIAERAENKERASLMTSLTDAAKVNGNARHVTELLGAKNMDEFNALPIAKIRKVAEKYAKAEEARA